MARGSRGSKGGGGYDRPTRVGDLIKQEIATMLIYGDIKDPRVGLVTITDVKMTRDLKNARVFFTMTGASLQGGLKVEGSKARGGESKDGSNTSNEAKGVRRGLQNASGFIRRELGKKLSLKYIPSITFEYDSSLDYATKINKVITEINKEEGSD